MDLENLARLSDLVLEQYFNKCIYCFRRETCGTLENIMDKTMKLIQEVLDDNLELILGEV